MRRGDAPADLGVTGVPTTQDGGADTMRPGALRGAARGRNLDGLAHTLFLRLSPVIAALVLATQVVIAWVNYGDQIRIEGERARTMADMTARALAHPGWTTAYGPPLQALGLDPAFRSAILRDAREAWWPGSARSRGGAASSASRSRPRSSPAPTPSPPAA